MRSEIPFPIPRFVISSPIHMSSVVAVASETTISTNLPVVRVSAPWRSKRYE